MIYATACAYNAFLLAGTVWLVGWQGWSPWWFLLALALFLTVSHDKDDK